MRSNPLPTIQRFKQPLHFKSVPRLWLLLLLPYKPFVMGLMLFWTKMLAIPHGAPVFVNQCCPHSLYEVYMGDLPHCHAVFLLQ
jgi:hypothetical protein